MKTRLVIEVETKDQYEVFPEDGQCEEDFDTDEKKLELKEFQEAYPLSLHQEVTDKIKKYFKHDFEENFIDDMEENFIEGILSKNTVSK